MANIPNIPNQAPYEPKSDNKKVISLILSIISVGVYVIFSIIFGWGFAFISLILAVLALVLGVLNKDLDKMNVISISISCVIIILSLTLIFSTIVSNLRYSYYYNDYQTNDSIWDDFDIDDDDDDW